MQIILLDKVVNLGNLGEIVKVKAGYARNFLIPAGRARRATEAAKAEFEAKRAELEKAAAAKLAEAQAQGENLAGTTVKLTQSRLRAAFVFVRLWFVHGYPLVAPTLSTDLCHDGAPHGR